MSTELCKGKSSWPELVGVDGYKAKAIIEKENPFVTAVIIPEGSPLTADFSCNRVRILVNKDNIVTRVPFIGKRSWPELLGAEGGRAVATIERENPLVTAITILEGSPVTADFRCNRVWVWVNTYNIVTRVPVIG